MPFRRQADKRLQEFSSDLPNMAATSAPSRSPPLAASQSPSLASKLDSSEYHQDPRAVPDEFRKKEDSRAVPDVTKWYQRPVYRWIFLGSILFACVSLGAVVVVVVLVVRQPSAASSSSLTFPSTAPSTAAPTTTDPTTAARTSQTSTN
jgi:hypothetical protein